MGNLGSECIISHLEQGLSHRNQNVASAARRSLGGIQHENSEIALLRHFHNSSSVDTRARVQALRGLSKMNCSSHTAFSILLSGLEIVGKPASSNNETCQRLCSLRCSIRGPVKCHNFCSHQCNNLLMFKAELGRFLYSMRKSGSFLDLVSDALSSGLFAGLVNMGIFPETETKSLTFGFGHRPIDWKKEFGSLDTLGAGVTLHLENTMRIWLSAFERGMEAVFDNFFSLSAHAWFQSLKIFETGIAFEAKHSSRPSLQPSLPDLKTTLSEWRDLPPSTVNPVPLTFVESLWKISSVLDSMDDYEPFMDIVRRNRQGQQAITAFCEMSENISSTLSGAFEIESLESSVHVLQRLKALDRFTMVSGEIIKTMQSAQRHFAETNSAFLNSSAFLQSAMREVQDDVKNHVEDLEQQGLLESVKALVNVSDKLFLVSGTMALSTDLLTLQTFRRKAALLAKSRYWGALEPAVDYLALLPENLAVLQMAHHSLKEAALRPHASVVAKLRERLADSLETETVLLESARVIKRRFLDFMAAKDIQNSVTLNAFKKGALEVKSHIAQLAHAWSKVNIEDLTIIQTMLMQREASLILLKRSLSPTGLSVCDL